MYWIWCKHRGGLSKGRSVAKLESGLVWDEEDIRVWKFRGALTKGEKVERRQHVPLNSMWFTGRDKNQTQTEDLRAMLHTLVLFLHCFEALKYLRQEQILHFKKIFHQKLLITSTETKAGESPEMFCHESLPSQASLLNEVWHTDAFPHCLPFVWQCSLYITAMARWSPGLQIFHLSALTPFSFPCPFRPILIWGLSLTTLSN